MSRDLCVTTCFTGSTVKALDYFAHYDLHLPPKVNPADFMMDVIGASAALGGSVSYDIMHRVVIVRACACACACASLRQRATSRKATVWTTQHSRLPRCLTCGTTTPRT